jgi:ubiquinone/menaquinone biosynthesis C-methylase UbiE
MNDAYVGLGAREGSAKGAENITGRISLMDGLVPLEGSRFLDIGCGNGAYTIDIARRFESGVGIDIEPDRLADFRLSLRNSIGDKRLEVLECSATAVPYPDASFDVITAIETMEHLGPYREATLAEAARLLNSGGTFYLTTPNRWWPIEQHGFELRGKRLRAGSFLS